jgi:hypothetical protein
VWPQGFQPEDINQIVCRARRRRADYDGRTLSGFTVGQGVVMARIYNKSLEIKASGKDWFLNCGKWMQAYRCGGRKFN